MNYTQLAKKHDISIVVHPTSDNPNMPDFMGYHYLIEWFHGAANTVTYFSKGPALKTFPTLEEVLENLGEELHMFSTHNDLEDFIQSYGYDQEEGERVYNNLEELNNQMVYFLGRWIVNEIMYGDDEDLI